MSNPSKDIGGGSKVVYEWCLVVGGFRRVIWPLNLEMGSGRSGGIRIWHSGCNMLLDWPSSML